MYNKYFGGGHYYSDSAMFVIRYGFSFERLQALYCACAFLQDYGDFVFMVCIFLEHDPLYLQGIFSLMIIVMKSSRQKEYMWKHDPRCERCGVVTVLAKDCPGKIMRPDGGFDLPDPPDNLATIQHRYSKTHHKRKLSGREVRGERRHFLWCYRCNQDYNDLYENPGTNDINLNKTDNEN